MEGTFNSLEDPICLEPMVDPVVAPCGHSFSRHSILVWLKSKEKQDGNNNTSGIYNGTCPICKEMICSTDLRPNYSLRAVIEESSKGQNNKEDDTCDDNQDVSVSFCLEMIEKFEEREKRKRLEEDNNELDQLRSIKRAKTIDIVDNNNVKNNVDNNSTNDDENNHSINNTLNNTVNNATNDDDEWKGIPCSQHISNEKRDRELYGTMSQDSSDDPAEIEKIERSRLGKDQLKVMDAVLNGENTFYTGPAGTGKSHLLMSIVRVLRAQKKVVALTASTGIAASHISGTTLHSWAGIGLGSEKVEKLYFKVTNQFDRLQNWRNADVLVIDEVSMITGDLLDKLEYLARQLREKQAPFGGLQLVLVGDFYQLPPVWNLTEMSTAIPGYQQPIPGYQQPNAGYQQPNPGYQQPNSGYQQLNPCNQQLNTDYQQPLPPYLQQILDYLQQMPGYQQPNPGYQQPNPGYLQPNPGYQQPNPGYQQPNPCYHQLNPGYQQLNPGYQRPNPGYQQPMRQTRAKFAFESEAWGCVQTHIQLTKCYRQSDPRFISMLNEVRLGHASTTSIQLLEEAQKPLSNLKSGIEPTKLFVTNASCDHENSRQLANIPSPSETFVAYDYYEDSRDRWLKSLPVQEKVELKVGAQVLLLRNLDSHKHLVNGSRGFVIGFAKLSSIYNTEAKVFSDKLTPSNDIFHTLRDQPLTPVVKFAKCDTPVQITTERFSVYVNDKLKAYRVQIPLKLAYAITIHKSQGLTLDAAQLDLSNVFECGHVYVALSRVRDLDCMQVTHCQPGSIRANPQVKMWTENIVWK